MLGDGRCPTCGDPIVWVAYHHGQSGEHDHRVPLTIEQERAEARATAEGDIVTLARQWANCEPGSLPDGIARNRMRVLFGLEDK